MSKSRLLAEAATMARRRSLRVGSSEAAQGDSVVELAALLEALLERAALDAPLLVCVGDLQWADSGTAAALRVLPSRLVALPIGWVLAYRPTVDQSHRRSRRPPAVPTTKGLSVGEQLGPLCDEVLDRLRRGTGDPFDGVG
jgi:hypothetical protein